MMAARTWLQLGVFFASTIPPEARVAQNLARQFSIAGFRLEQRFVVSARRWPKRIEVRKSFSHEAALFDAPFAGY